MRVRPPVRPAASGAAVGRAAGSGAPFPQLTPARAPAEAGRAVGAAPAPALGLWLAVQDLPDAAEKRRRAVRRGHGLLDRLEELELALLDGSLSRRCCSGSAWMRRASDRSADDPRLDAVLAEIETRAAVELAKLEVRRRVAEAGVKAGARCRSPVGERDIAGADATIDSRCRPNESSAQDSRVAEGDSMARRPGHGRGSAPRRMGGPR